MKRKLSVAAAATAMLALSALTGCGVGGATQAASGGPQAPSGSVGVAGEGDANAKDLCGTKPTVVALADGLGDSTWAKIALAELQDEASKCPNVTKVLYANGHGSAQQTIQAINGFTSQGVNVLLVRADAGPVMLPAMRAATKAGVTVIDWLVDIGGVPGTDYTAKAVQGTANAGKVTADWYGTHLKSGNLAMVGGPAGGGWSSKYYNAFLSEIKKYPAIKVLQTPWVATDWTPASITKSVSGLMARYPQIDAIATDYSPVATQTAETFKAAGRKIPMLSTVASDNQLGCTWKDFQAQGDKFPLFTTDKTTSIARNGFRRGMADFQGIKLDEPEVVNLVVGTDTFAGKEPLCDKSFPPDADLHAGLSKEKLQALLR